MLSNQNSSSDLKITGSLDVEIISAAESRITLKLINAPESPTDSVRFLLKDTDTRTILYPEISSQSSDTYLLDFTALQELHEYRYTKPSVCLQKWSLHPGLPAIDFTKFPIPLLPRHLISLLKTFI